MVRWRPWGKKHTGDQLVPLCLTVSCCIDQQCSWQLRVTQGQRRPHVLTHALSFFICLLFLINPCCQILFSPSCLHRQVRGQGRYASWASEGFTTFLKEDTTVYTGILECSSNSNQKTSRAVLCVFTCSDFTFPWMLSWDAPRASLASDESETKTESCDKALLPRLIFDLWETGRGRNKQSRKWSYTATKPRVNNRKTSGDALKGQWFEINIISWHLSRFKVGN